MDYLPYVQAHWDFYRPLEEADDIGTVYRASVVPDDWRRNQSGIWAMHRPPGAPTVTHGWKVHVSASYKRAQDVLDAAAAMCVEREVPLKHLRSSPFFIMLHHKQAYRPQSGKFIAAYPLDEAVARKLMEALARATSGEEGPYILGDRRWRESRVVSYRYGAAPHLDDPYSARHRADDRQGLTGALRPRPARRHPPHTAPAAHPTAERSGLTSPPKPTPQRA